MRRPLVATVLTLSLTLANCGGQPVAPSDTAPPGQSSPTTPAVETFAPAQLFVGAGDIANCDAGAEATSRLLDGIGGLVFVLGDNAYPNGTAQQYRDCYAPTWGRHRSRSRPVPGNHEYDVAGATAYYDYFGALAGPTGLGYYSFDLGAWHIIALNSNIGMDRRSVQAAWLRRDLITRATRCTLAFWHHPLFSSGAYGDTTSARDLWDILYSAGVDVILNGHEHLYERFALQDPNGQLDQEGIRQFTVGTGGAPLRDRVRVKANSEVVLTTHGVLKLTLRGAAYDWQFVAVSGPGDSGTESCH